LDFCSNLIYDWGYKAGYSGLEGEYADINYCDNVLVAGPSTTWLASAFEGGSKGTRIYQRGNLVDVNRNGIPDGRDQGWAAFNGTFTQVDAPFSVPQIGRDEARKAYRLILSLAGATPWARDSSDASVVADVLAEKGRIVNTVDEAGGWPALETAPAPPDADNDGMPDLWERALGHHPAQADHNGDADGDGYTNLEGYLNWLGRPHAMTMAGTPLDIDLRVFTKGFPEAAYEVVASSGGEAVLRPGGYHVRFVPAGDAGGLARVVFRTRQGRDVADGEVQILVVPN
jgi:hypothetical protein